MIENTLWMTYFEYLPIELKQAEEEGKNVELYRKEIEEIIKGIILAAIERWSHLTPYRTQK